MPGQKIETGHTDIIHDVSMDYYGKRVASASFDATIKIISVSSQHLATLTGHNGPVWQVIWAHPKFGSLLASCSYDGNVIIWKEDNLNNWTPSRTFNDHKSFVNSIAWAPHELSLCLACASSDGNISVYTARQTGPALQRRRLRSYTRKNDRCLIQFQHFEIQKRWDPWHDITIRPRLEHQSTSLCITCETSLKTLIIIKLNLICTWI